MPSNTDAKNVVLIIGSQIVLKFAISWLDDDKNLPEIVQRKYWKLLKFWKY